MIVLIYTSVFGLPTRQKKKNPSVRLGGRAEGFP
jgi:hypothetical protein